MSSTKRPLRNRGFLRSVQGGKEAAPDTPAQRLGLAVQNFLHDYLKKHGGIDAMNASKVLLQLASKIAVDHGATAEEFGAAAKSTFEEVSGG